MRAITFLFSGVCHQIGERCLVFGGRSLPLCARCTGTFLAFLLALLVLRLVERGRPNGLPTGGSLLLLGGLTALWAFDGANSFADLVWGRALYPPSNGLRLLTGVGFGLGLGALLYPIWHGVMWRRTDDRPVLACWWQSLVLLAAGGALATLVLRWHTAPWWLWVVAASAGALIPLASANAALLVLLLRREGRGERWTQVAPWLALGACLALAEMATVATVRSLL